MYRTLRFLLCPSIEQANRWKMMVEQFQGEIIRYEQKWIKNQTPLYQRKSEAKNLFDQQAYQMAYRQMKKHRNQTQCWWIYNGIQLTKGFYYRKGNHTIRFIDEKGKYSQRIEIHPNKYQFQYLAHGIVLSMRLECVEKRWQILLLVVSRE